MSFMTNFWEQILGSRTDFSRPLPLLGPKRVWASLPVVVNSLLTGAIRDGVVAALYKEVFSTHVSSGRTTMASVLQQLLGSKLSDTTKNRLPSVAQVECTLKNVQWVMAYWGAVNGNVDTPLNGENGYVRGETHGSVTFSA